MKNSGFDVSNGTLKTSESGFTMLKLLLIGAVVLAGLLKVILFSLSSACLAGYDDLPAVEDGLGVG